MGRRNRYNPNTRQKLGAPPSQRRERQRTCRASSPDLNRDAIAEAVHLACCERRGGNGLGACQMYAAAGWFLLEMLDADAGFAIQGGDFRIQPDPDDPTFWFTILSENGGWARGELHCWLANAAGEVIDFSARHYRAMCESFLNFGDEPRPSWNRPAPPAYIWARVEDLPPWVGFRAVMETSAAVNGASGPPAFEVEALFRAAWRHYERLTN